MFKDFIQPIMQYLHAHPQIGIVVAFVIAFAESLPLIGTIIPGSVTMTALGALIGTAILPGFSTLAWAAAGAFTGDCLGFWIGYYFKDSIQKTWPLKNNPKWLIMGEAFFAKHGGKSIIIGRFVGPVRSAIPLIAGILKMQPMRFYMAAVPSAIAWAIVYMLPGILLGAISMELPPAKTTEFMLAGVGIIVFIWFIFWLIQYFFRNLAMFINRKVDQLWDWLNKHHPSEYVIRLIRNRRNPSDHHQLTLFLLALLTLNIFIGLLLYIVIKGPYNLMDYGVFHLAQSLRTPIIDNIMVFISNCGDTKTMALAGLLIAFGLSLARQWRPAIQLAIFTIITAIAVLVFKYVSYSPRPSGFVIVKATSSFPSGHTAMSFFVASYTSFLINQYIKKRWHAIAYTIAGVFITLVAVSRLYLGAHWFLDITGSLLLGTTMLCAGIISYRRLLPSSKNNPLKQKHLWIILGVSLALCWSISNILNFYKKLKATQPIYPVISLNMQQWWKNPIKYLPTYRLNRLGRPIQPFNVQWAAPIEQIEKTLTAQGWTIFQSSFNLQSTLRKFVKKNPEYHMPLLPFLYQDQPPALVIIKHLDGKTSILELRLWKTKVDFTDSNLPVWIGALNFHRSANNLLSAYSRQYQISFRDGNAIQQLQPLISNFESQVITIPTQKQPKKIKSLNWNGQVLILRSK